MYGCFLGSLQSESVLRPLHMPPGCRSRQATHSSSLYCCSGWALLVQYLELPTLKNKTNYLSPEPYRHCSVLKSQASTTKMVKSLGQSSSGSPLVFCMTALHCNRSSLTKEPLTCLTNRKFAGLQGNSWVSCFSETQSGSGFTSRIPEWVSLDMLASLLFSLPVFICHFCPPLICFKLAIESTNDHLQHSPWSLASQFPAYLFEAFHSIQVARGIYSVPRCPEPCATFYGSTVAFHPLLLLWLMGCLSTATEHLWNEGNTRTVGKKIKVEGKWVKREDFSFPWLIYWFIKWVSNGGIPAENVCSCSVCNFFPNVFNSLWETHR